jgi:hypothetical protein
MNEWFKCLFPEASNDQDTVLLYSLQTRNGELQVHTRVATFKVSFVHEPRELWLALNGTRSSSSFSDVFGAVVAASKHQTGIQGFDESDERISDYLLDWQLRVEKHTIFNYIDLWILENPQSSLREMVDYFEHEATHMVDRENLEDFLEEMIISGQVKRLPRDWMTPSELDRILRLAKEYGVDVPGNRYCK